MKEKIMNRESFVWVKDKSGAIYSCERDKLTDIRTVSEEDLKNCVAEGNVGANMSDTFTTATERPVKVTDSHGIEYLCPANELKRGGGMSDRELEHCFRSTDPTSP